MIQSISGFNNTFALEKLQEANKKKTSESTNLSAALTGVAETTDVTDSTAISTTKVRTTDVIEISAEGRAALAAQNAQSAESETHFQATESDLFTQLTEESTESETAPHSSQGLDKMATPTPQETTEDASSTVDLSGLTEEQIDSLVEEGTITQADANVELAKREAEEVAKKAAEKAAEETTTPPPSAPPKESTYNALSTNGAIAVWE